MRHIEKGMDAAKVSSASSDVGYKVAWGSALQVASIRGHVGKGVPHRHRYWRPKWMQDIMAVKTRISVDERGLMYTLR